MRFAQSEAQDELLARLDGVEPRQQSGIQHSLSHDPTATVSVRPRYFQTFDAPIPIGVATLLQVQGCDVMKTFTTVMVSALFLAAPAFADSVTVQTNDTAGVAVSPPVAVMPAPAAGERIHESTSVKQSDDGKDVKSKRTEETMTPAGTERTTTKTETKSGDDD